MASAWGKMLKLSIFGESHGAAIGVVIDGLPAGCRLDMEQIQAQMNRRAPGGRLSTQRKEADQVKILSGMLGDTTTGVPIAGIIENTDTRSKDYHEMETLARPGHADYTAFVHYDGFQDVRGGDIFQAVLLRRWFLRELVALQILEKNGIYIGAHIRSVGSEEDARFDPVRISSEELLRIRKAEFPSLSPEAGERMQKTILAVKQEGDSIGGIIECAVIGVPPGVGEPIYDGVENVVSSLIFSIPAVKGIEFGSGFSGAYMMGSQHNDRFLLREGEVVTETNRHGGILGGITSGMPILFSVAVKPTASILKPQETVNYLTGQEASLQIRGRHDPCIVPRAVPCVESAAALALLELLLENRRLKWREGIFA